MNTRTLVVLLCVSMQVPIAPIFGQEGAWNPTGMIGERLNIRTLFVAANGDVFAGTDSALYRSQDRGMSWSAVGPSGVNEIVQQSSDVLIAAGREGVHRSDDGGIDWNEVVPKPHRDSCGDILQFTFVSSWGTDTVIAGAIEENTGSGPCKIEPEMYRSIDNGKSWERNGPMSWIIAATVTSPNKLLVGDALGSIMTVDVRHVLPVERSSWTVLSTLNVSVTDVALSPSGAMYAATGTMLEFDEGVGRGIFRSTDDGETWQQINEGLTDTTVTDLAVYENGTLLASTLYGGVYCSTDGGDTWHPLNAGLPSLWVTALAITEGGYVYAGTSAGVFRSTSTIATVAEVDEGLPTGFDLQQNYPNPFNPSTTITYTLPRSSSVRLTVYDVMGREVRRLVNGVQPGGSHAVRFEAQGLPSGVYLYRLEAGAYAEERRMALVR